MSNKTNTPSFEARLESHLKSTVAVLKDRQVLIEDAYSPASKDNNFNKIAALLNGLWSVRAYRSSKSIVDYLEAHSPMRITHVKGADTPYSVKLMVKDSDGNRDQYQELKIAYNVWEKSKVEEELTADKLIGRIDSAIKASAELNDSELKKFDKHIAGLQMAA